VLVVIGSIDVVDESAVVDEEAAEPAASFL
jgi:hypothetical protein